MPRLRLLIEYDGTDYAGWQAQPGERTVQGEIEAALATILRQKPAFMGSGRTDAGVHARGQVAHVEVEGDVDPFRLRGSLNGLLPLDIRILDAERASGEFHARYDARRRLYHYHVSTAPRALDRLQRMPLHPAPDFDAMNAAAAVFVGTQEFSALCRTKSPTINRVCTVTRARWVREEREGDWRFEMEANRFVHGMVRATVGTLLEVGRGRRDSTDLPALLASGDRRLAGPAAPARGLVLHHVGYTVPVFGRDAVPSEPVP